MYCYRVWRNSVARQDDCSGWEGKVLLGSQDWHFLEFQLRGSVEGPASFELELPESPRGGGKKEEANQILEIL